MSPQVITTAKELADLCQELSKADAIAFDTEFVAEHTYRPVLCLLQVATADHLVAVDPLAVGDMKPFWEVVTQGDHETIVHAGREEMCFCLDATGQIPKRLVDVQLGAGLMGNEYPSGYSTLTYRLLSVQTGKGETRTDWRKRPLHPKQIEYALDDVRYLIPLRDVLYKRLEKLDRRRWLTEETAAWVADLRESRARERWRRVSGSGNLPARTLAVIRELWQWRETEAEKRDWPPRRVLRDDLIVEIAKRRVVDPKQVLAVRGLERSHLHRAADELVACVERALAIPDEDLPRTQRSESSPQLTMLGQFLSSALNSICRDAQVATSLVGNPSDVRDLVSYRLKEGKAKAPGEAPRLTEGWRAEVVGKVLDDLIAGKVTIRITEPDSEQPLVFEPYVPKQ